MGPDEGSHRWRLRAQPEKVKLSNHLPQSLEAGVRRQPLIRPFGPPFSARVEGKESR